MAINVSVLQGRIPFEIRMFNEGDERKAVAMFAISVQRNYKPAGEQYYPEDLIDCKAFGQQANFINQYFDKGSFAMLQGELRRNDDYTDESGEEVRGQMYFHVNSVSFQQGGSRDNSEGAGTKTTSSKKSTQKRPAAKKSSANPFTARRNKVI